jgi:2,3-bisphosphoglycerate-dependent phosphoglycerate mutase
MDLKDSEKMKRIVLGLFFLGALILLAGNIIHGEKEGPTTLILVRHAEKAADGSADPPLTPEGERRAEELALVLDLMDIRAVYSTPYRRTRRTAAPTAEKKGLGIREYKPGHEDDFIRQVIADHKGETVLVVGHSNTVPRLANAAAGRDLFSDLEDSVYDNLFIAVLTARSPAAVYRLRFGSHRE